MKRIALFERNKARHILNQNRTRLKGIYETQILFEKVIALIERAADRRINREALTRRSASYQGQLPLLHAKPTTNIIRVKLTDVLRHHRRTRMIAPIRIGVLWHNFRRENAMESRLLKPFRQTAGACEEVNH